MSVAQLSMQHHEQVLALFANEQPYYYFLINDLLDNDYAHDEFKVYGEFDADDRLVSILLNNFNNLTYYSGTDRSFDVYKEVLSECKFNKISGPSRLVEKLLPYVDVKSDTLSYLGVVTKVSVRRRYPDLPLRMITDEIEVGQQYDLLVSANEYQMPSSREAYIREQMHHLQHSNDRTVYLSKDGVMVASCSTRRETRNSAIIIGVVTHPAHRRQGYGTEVLIGLFEQLLQEGKFPYLFYNNPAARSVYKNLGMTEVCEWRVVFIAPSIDVAAERVPGPSSRYDARSEDNRGLHIQ